MKGVTCWGWMSADRCTEKNGNCEYLRKGGKWYLFSLRCTVATKAQMHIKLTSGCFTLIKISIFAEVKGRALNCNTPRIKIHTYAFAFLMVQNKGERD